MFKTHFRIKSIQKVFVILHTTWQQQYILNNRIICIKHKKTRIHTEILRFVYIKIPKQGCYKPESYRLYLYLTQKYDCPHVPGASAPPCFSSSRHFRFGSEWRESRESEQSARTETQKLMNTQLLHYIR